MLGQQRLGLRAAQAGLERRGHRVEVDARAARRTGPGRARRRRRTRRAARPGRPRRRCPRRTAPARRAAPRPSAISAATSSWVPGRTTASGESDPSPARSRSRSGVDLPRVRCSRVSWSVSTCSSPTMPRSSASRSSASGSLSRTCAGSTAGVSVVPRKASTSARALSGSGPASAGSPQRDQCISPRLPGSLMCYSVTHDVYSSQGPRPSPAASRTPTSTRPGRRSSPSAGAGPR